MIATAIPGAVSVVTSCTLPNGVHVIELDYDGTFDDVRSKPTALLFEGRTYGRSGHNSDTFRVYYRTDVQFATAKG